MKASSLTTAYKIKAFLEKCAFYECIPVPYMEEGGILFFDDNSIL